MRMRMISLEVKITGERSGRNERFNSMMPGLPLVLVTELSRGVIPFPRRKGWFRHRASTTQVTPLLLSLEECHFGYAHEHNSSSTIRA